MASSSGTVPSIQKNFKYDVFLSFRGEDTRKTFVDHLYHALHHKGIITYKDDERMEKGRNISDELIRSIEDSKFHIIVFSKNYASSSWCLNELVKIMQCHNTIDQTAYPLFYDVEPTEVRKQSGAVGKAFAKHEKEEAAERWRNALSEAAGLAGWDNLIESSITYRHEAKFIKKIVEDISLKLHSINFSVDENLVGMETRVNDIVSSLETGYEGIQMIGIKGMGGGGKTTLARAIFYHISIFFEGKSFVENVREVSKGSLSGLKELQKHVLSDVLNDPNIDIRNVSDGKNMMKKMMCSRKVLVVLDYVDHIEQLEALAGNPNWFKPGSIIIITTRDEQVLVAHGVHVDNIHNVNLLLDEEALCLFHMHAFKREIPNQMYEELSGKVVRYAAGLPLTIKVLGSFLCGRTKREWENTIERLETIPLKETLEKLELSYVGLEDDLQQIFLDVACILKGERKDEAIRVLESCGFCAEIGLRVLEQRSLITISSDGHLLMHDHIQEMGRNIVRRLHPYEPKRHNRLWIKQEIEDILVNELGTEATRCIKLVDSNLHPAVIMKGLRKMNDLRFIHVNTHFGEVDEADRYLPNTLRSLHWPGYPLECLPNTFQAYRLVDLAMVRSKICQLWKWGEYKVLNKLRFLDLKYSNLRTFDLGMTLQLEMLDLRECNDFLELHMPVTLQKLKFLNLSGSNVSNLNLALTPHLEKLTLSIKDMRHLPNGICMLKHLKYLKLKSCWLLEQLPEDLCRLECLEELHLTDCSVLQDLPNNICMMKRLKYLHLPYIGVKKLPEELGLLEGLKELNIEGACISHLPVSIFQLKGTHNMSLLYPKDPILKEVCNRCFRF
ncbi:TMV resistance protein N-like [Helianthus annuus]|uniref:TMV resistance protein N-like n=1 Tax=Helianthus annuus TaxID=4232 RepID=UPI000B900505|nr:TMV resistance protein N-like [Helianthus annuus]